ncbi:MAG TPA: FGLLP motif-containing membrane protein [Candidatus Dormibacteraeota bacterium]
MWRWLILGAPLALVGLTACSAPASVRIDRIDYASQDYENGPKSDFTVYWSGNPKLPLSLEYTPAPGCSQGSQTCAAGTYLFPRQANPLVWSGATDCVGNLGPGTPPWTGGSYYTLVDAAGNRSDRVLLVNTCYYHPVATVLRSAVFHHQPWLTQVLRPVTQISWKALDVSKSLVISLGLIFLIAFPSQLFNSTMQSHYDEVMGWFRWVPRPRPRDSGRAPRWLIAVVFLLGGVLGSLLDPRWGFDGTTLEAVAGILLASAFTTIVYTFVHAAFLRRVTGLRGYFRVYGGGIAVAGGCVLVSRLTQAEPGYLYGVLLGYTLGAAAPRLARPHEGRNVALGAGTMLIASVAMWLLWTPVKAAADATEAFPLVVLSTAMAGVFAGGITSLLFGLLPLRWLDGEKLLAWQRFVWLPLVLIAMFLFIHVVMNNAASTEHAGRNLVVTVALFVAFGALSTGFWAYFRFRPEPVAIGSATATP